MKLILCGGGSGEQCKMLYDKLIEYSRETFDNLDKCMDYSKFPLHDAHII